MISTQEQSEWSSQFKRKQIVIWGFLLLFTVATTSSIFYLAYRMMSESGSQQAPETSRSAIKIPVSSKPAAAAIARSGNYFLHGEFFSQDKKYKIFKVYYDNAVKEEIYSFPWRDADKIPGLATDGSRIAIFLSFDGGFMIDHAGKLAMPDKFAPPTQYFSASPDGKKMFYFKFMSSLGNPKLVLRDLEKDADIFTWPLNSPASEICDFAGWSPDGARAYCLGKKGSAASLKMLDARNRSYSTLKTIGSAADAKYYPEYSLLLYAVKNTISIYNQSTGEDKLVISTPENAPIANVFLAPDGQRIFYTAGNKVYSVKTDGSDNQNPLGARDAELISLSADYRAMLFKTPDAGNGSRERYLAGDLEGKNILDLFSADRQADGIQMIGWYKSQ